MLCGLFLVFLSPRGNPPKLWGGGKTKIKKGAPKKKNPGNGEKRKKGKEWITPDSNIKVEKRNKKLKPWLFRTHKSEKIRRY